MARILLVDRDAVFRARVRRLLARRFEVVVAADGAAALALGRARPPDLVLAGEDTPGPDGMGLFEALRRDPQMADATILRITSGDAERPAAAAGAERGADDDHLSRSAQPRELLAAVRAHLHAAHRRRAAQSRLRESEERYRRLVGLLPVGVYTCAAPSGVIAFHNEQAARLWGRSPAAGDTDERFCGSLRLWRTDGTPLPHDQTPMAVALREGRPFRNVDVVVERPDGSRIDVMVNIDPIFDEHGRLVGAINAFHDTTALRRAQDALHDSERRLSTLVANLPGLVYRRRDDPQGTVEFVSQGVTAVTGYAVDDFVDGRVAWSALGHPEDAGEVRESMREALRARRPYRVEYRIRHRDGGLRWVWEQGEGVFGEDGRLVALEGFVADVTARKQNEAALSARQAELDLIAASTPLILCRCSRDLRYRFANRAAGALFGRAPAEMVGRPVAEIMGPEAFAIVRPHIERVLQGEAVEYEAEFPTADGGRRWLHVNYMPELDARGAVTGWIASGVDVTERKRAELALQEADRHKDEFLAMLGHELRNPLAPIRTGLELMKLLRDDPAALERTRSTMERQTLRLIALVDDLLDVSRVTRGKLELRRSAVTLDEIVQNAVEATRPFVEAAGHELSVELPGQQVHLHADANRLVQVLTNVLDNAVKYTPPDGRILLRARRDGSEVVLEVQDTGVGIAAGMLERVFDMFAQGEGPAGGRAGLGIGLTLCRSIVTMHGGSVTAASDGPGRGSTFRIRLPAAPAAAAPPAAPSASAAGDGRAEGAAGGPARAPAATRRVLVVDDNPAAADTLSAVVRMLGNEVRTAYDGAEACAVAAEFRPEVVLMDLGMPRMDGYATARRMRGESWGRGALLVALSGWGQHGDRQRSREAGFDHHLVKPAEPAELRQLLDGLGRTVD